MTKIKICGLTRHEDAIWANEMMPDYVGFVFAQSKRRIDVKKACEIADKLNPNIKKVGIFVNQMPEHLSEIIKSCRLDIAQLHGDETPEYCNQIDIPVWKAMSVKSKRQLDALNHYGVEAILLDGYSEDAKGGTGTGFNWDWAKEMNFNMPLVLAGGLNADNVLQAINTLHPFAVDVSSSVETNGVKDFTKIITFIRKVRDINGK